jgi:hypothetical protein
MWRLSAEALRNGCVHSTTRYRNKQPNKRLKSHHSDHSQLYPGLPRGRGHDPYRHSPHNPRRSSRIQSSSRPERLSYRSTSYGVNSSNSLAKAPSLEPRSYFTPSPLGVQMYPTPPRSCNSGDSPFFPQSVLSDIHRPGRSQAPRSNPNSYMVTPYPGPQQGNSLVLDSVAGVLPDVAYPGHLAFSSGFLKHLEEPVPTRMPERIFTDTESSAGMSEPHTPSSLFEEYQFDTGVRDPLMNLQQGEGEFNNLYDYLQPGT